MANPFLTAKPMACLPVNQGISLTMCTDPAHASACGMRFSIDRVDEAGPPTAYTDRVSSSGASVQERLVATVTGLTKDAQYDLDIQYEEVSGSGTWVALSDPVTIWTFPSTAGTLELAFLADPHHTQATIIDSEDTRTVRSTNALTYLAASKRHLLIRMGDESFGTSGSTQSELTTWAIAWRGHMETAHDAMPDVGVLGNHELRDGTASTDDSRHETMNLQFMANTSNDSAKENYGTIENDLATIIFAEAYTESGFPNASTSTECALGTTQLTHITDAIAANTKAWLIICLHNLAITSKYWRCGGETVAMYGSDMRTIHEAIIAHRAANASLVGAIVVYGHDHNFMHETIDGVHYLQVGSTATPITYTDADQQLYGYRLADGTLNPRCGFFDEDSLGVMTMALSATEGTVQFVRTTDTDGSTADSTVLHKFTIKPTKPAMRDVGLRPAGLRMRRAA